MRNNVAMMVVGTMALFGCGGEAELQPLEQPTEEVEGTIAIELQHEPGGGCRLDGERPNLWAEHAPTAGRPKRHIVRPGSCDL